MQNLQKFCVCLLTLFDCRNNENNVCSRILADLNICNCITDVCKILKYLIEQDFEFFFSRTLHHLTMSSELIMRFAYMMSFNFIIYQYFVFSWRQILRFWCILIMFFNDCYYSYSVYENMNKLIICFIFFIHDVLFFSSNWHIRKEEF